MKTQVGLHTISDILIRDEEVLCRADRRLKYQEYGSGELRLPVVRVQDARQLSPQYRAWLGVENVDGPLDLVGGGLSHLISAVPDVEPHLRNLLGLLQEIVADSRSSGAAVIVPFAMDSIRSLVQAAGLPVTESHAPSFFRLPIGGAASRADVISMLPRNRRKVWARDRRLIDSQNLHYEFAPLTHQGCVEASAAMSATSHRNGGQSHRVLAEWQLRASMDRSGMHTLIRLQHEGSTLGYAVASEFLDVLEVHSFGVESDVHDRSQMYQLMFTASVDLATSRLSREIWFGIEHRWPKFLRGCVEDLRWNIRFEPKGS